MTIEEDEIMEFVQLARKGDVEALNEVAARLDRPLRKFASIRFPKFLKRRADESDIRQDAMINILDSICDFKGSTASSFLAWACFKVRAAIKNAAEKHTRGKRNLHLEVVGADANDPIEVAIADNTSPSQTMQRAEELEQLITELPDPLRIVMQLLYSDGMTPERTAESLSWSMEEVETIRVKGLRQLEKLRRKLLESGTTE